MKFSTQIIALIAATAVHASPVMEKRTSSACDQALDSYNECINGIVSMKNVDTVCAAYSSEKCQNFYKSGFVNEIEACKNEDPKMLSLLEDVISLSSESLKHTCTKDENGNFCPMVKLNLENKILFKGTEDPIYIQASNDTCKSKVCTDTYVQYLEQIKVITLRMDEKEKAFEQNVDNKVSEFEEKVKNKVNELEEGLNNFENKVNEEIESIENKFKRSVEEDLKEIDDEIAKFKADQCTSQAPTTGQGSNINQVVSGNSTANGNTQTSDASTLSYSSALLVATILLLSTLL